MGRCSKASSQPASMIAVPRDVLTQARPSRGRGRPRLSMKLSPANSTKENSLPIEESNDVVDKSPSLRPKSPKKGTQSPRKNTVLKEVTVSPSNGTKITALEKSPSLRPRSPKKNGQSPKKKDIILTEEVGSPRSRKKRIVEASPPSPIKRSIKKSVAARVIFNKRKATVPQHNLKLPDDKERLQLKHLDVQSLWQMEKARHEEGYASPNLFRSRSHSLVPSERTIDSEKERIKEKKLEEVLCKLKEKQLGEKYAQIICVDVHNLVDGRSSGIAKGSKDTVTTTVELFLAMESQNDCKLIDHGRHTLTVNDKTKEPLCIEIHYTNQERQTLKNIYMIMRTKLSRFSDESRGRARADRDMRSVSALPVETDILIGVLHLAHRNKKNDDLHIDFAPSHPKSLILLKERCSPIKNASWMSDTKQLESIISFTKKRTRETSELPYVLLTISQEYEEDEPEEQRKFKVPQFSVKYVTNCLSSPTTSKTTPKQEMVLGETDSCCSPFDGRSFLTVQALTAYLSCTTHMSFQFMGLSNNVATIEVSKCLGIPKQLPLPQCKSSGVSKKLCTTNKSFSEIIKGPRAHPIGPISTPDYYESFNPVVYIPCRGMELDRPTQRASVACDWFHMWEKMNIHDFTDIAPIEKEFFVLWTKYNREEQVVENSQRETWRVLKKFRATIYETFRANQEYDMVRMWLSLLRTLTMTGKISCAQEMALITNNYSKIPDLPERCRGNATGSNKDDRSEKSSGSESTSGSVHCTPVKNGLKKNGLLNGNAHNLFVKNGKKRRRSALASSPKRIKRRSRSVMQRKVL